MATSSMASTSGPLYQERARQVHHHPGRVKWYNGKAGYGFIEDQDSRTDVFVHVSGLSRPLKKTLPREGDEVFFVVHLGVKGPEARNVTLRRTPTHPSQRLTHTPHKEREGNIQEKILACVYTAKAIAGTDNRHLQSLIPLLLRHNGLPAVHVPLLAFVPPSHDTTRTPRLCNSGMSNSKAPAGKRTGGQEEEDAESPTPAEDELRNTMEDHEDEEVDILANTSEDASSISVGEVAQSTAVSSIHDTPRRHPSEDESSPDDEAEQNSQKRRQSTESANREGDQGWIVKKKRRHKVKVIYTPSTTPIEGRPPTSPQPSRDSAKPSCPGVYWTRG